MTTISSSTIPSTTLSNTYSPPPPPPTTTNTTTTTSNNNNTCIATTLPNTFHSSIQSNLLDNRYIFDIHNTTNDSIENQLYTVDHLIKSTSMKSKSKRLEKHVTLSDEILDINFPPFLQHHYIKSNDYYNKFNIDNLNNNNNNNEKNITLTEHNYPLSMNPTIPHMSTDKISTTSLGSMVKYCTDNYDESPTTLILSRLEKLTLKDFASEVRANLDIDMFIKEATLLLDLDGSTLEDIISSMLEAIFDNRPIVDTATSTTATTNTTANMTPSSPSSPDDTDSNQWSRTSATTTSGFGPKVNFSITGNSDKTNLSKLDIENMKLEAKNSLMMQINYQGYTYQRLAKTIKGVSLTDDDCLSTDQSWICAMCSLRSIHKRYLALARLNNPVNFGRSSEGTYLIVLIITPTKEKGTKSEIEVGRTFGTILSDPIFRQELLFATDEKEVKLLLWDRAQQLAAQQSTDRRRSSQYLDIRNQTFNLSSQSMIGKGIYLDLKRKIPYYWSDITEGIRGKNTMRKTISTIIFLYFACLLPSIAFGLLNSKNTNKKMDVTRVIMGQTIGGLCYGVFGGQPLLVLLSTAPLALYIKIIYTISETYYINFYAMYACIGLFNSLFLIIYSVCGFSRWMKWSTRSTEEIFAMFVSMAFLYDAGNDLYSTFQENYHCKLSTNYSLISNETLNIQGFDINFIHSNYSFSRTSIENCPEILSSKSFPSLSSSSSSSSSTSSTLSSLPSQHINRNITIIQSGCQREVALVYLVLLLGTVWIALNLLNFTKTPFLTATKREILTDFALPIAVVSMSLVGSLIFGDIKLKPFEVEPSDFMLNKAPLNLLSWPAVLGSIGIAIPLSLLFYMEQNIASAILNSPSNKLRKGPSNHWDLFVIALINIVLSIFCLPWVHAALPHTPLHVKALADMEEHVDGGHHIRQTIIRVRETRLTLFISHVLIGLSLAMIPYPLIYIPPPVLNGLFIYMAITALQGNQMFERILLFITEQSAYPPSHYIRRVPQRKLHLFTFFQLIQLGFLCAFGFAPSPYVKLIFPVILVVQIVLRHTLIPKAIDSKYLEALDRHF
ncbi:unnamed protein product [Schistosoma rodhaini]|uniref:Bicarbonate transporter-like transmembrane domain-containing protein n=1 Tax=Schistosoma rodhaini TaxID=6188 RepID=A0AA85ELP3_9TREM|nr:unnamed protein product [Schistosoma rodhaini]